MSRYYNDPFRPRRHQPFSGRKARPWTTSANCRRLYEKLRTQYERQGVELAEAEQQLEIKSEVLQKQTTGPETARGGARLRQSRPAGTQTKRPRTNPAPAKVDWADRYARLQAEMENLRKRWEQRFASEIHGGAPPDPVGHAAAGRSPGDGAEPCRLPGRCIRREIRRQHPRHAASLSGHACAAMA